LADPDATTAEDVIERISATALGRELTALPKRYQRILRARFVLRRSQRAVASAEGVSSGRISQIEARIRDRLQPVAEVAEEPLTTRELKVLRLAADGASTDETAKRLRKACDTVKDHRHAIIAKLQARNMVNAVSIGYRRGLLR
jgi:DNA-binding NarL/FixJ family response regulator